MEYDIGRVDYSYVSLTPLRRLVPEPRVEDLGIPGPKVRMFSCEQEIRAPPDLVFDVASDLRARLHRVQRRSNC